MDATSSAASGPVQTAPRLVPIVLGIAVAVIAFLFLDHLNPPYAVTDDGVRDQLLARDCTDLGRCQLIGPATSLEGFQQGAVWLDLLIAVRLLGGDAETQRVVVIALLALGVATLFVVVWRWLHPSLALPAAVLLVGVLCFDVSTNLLVNSSAAPFPDILVAAGLLCHALSGRLRFLLVAAFALGLAVNVHAGSLILAAPLAAIAVLGGVRRWRALLAAAGVALATCYFTSSAALRDNVAGLVEHGRLLPVLALGLAVLAAAALLAPRFRRSSWDARAWLVGSLLILPYALGSLWLVHSARHPFAVIYLHPVMGPAAVFTAALICAPFELFARRLAMLRWLPSAAAAGVFAFAAAHPGLAARLGRVEMGAWSLPDALAVAGAAVQRGWSYEDLVFHLQGNWCRELLIGMSAVAPPPGAAAGRDSRQLQVVKMKRESLLPAERQDAIPLGPDAVAVVREIESWLRPEHLRACRAPLGSVQSPVCAAATPRAAGAVARERFLFVSRSYPESHSLDLPAPYVATYEIPLAPAAGESREIALTDPSAPQCAWRFTRADGIRVEGELPSRRVRLHSNDGSPATLVIEKPFGASGCESFDLDRRYPPCLLETPPGDPLQGREGVF
jgi:hypothetical protein